jgi:hypothetical protein
MRPSRSSPLLAAALLLLAGAACGSSDGSPAGFGSDPADTGAGGPAIDDGGTAAPVDAATVISFDDATPGFLLTDGQTAPTNCQPGKYTGQYDGTFQSLIPTSGPVTITLTAATKPNGEFELVTNNGTWDTAFAAVGDGAFETGHATLVGQLDCTAGSFTATGVDAHFYVLGLDGGTFTLTLSGTYDAATQTISGTFSYTSPDGNGGGNWHVTLSD